ncbi:MAG TPA: acyltransferase family protein [Egicoccus sp.]|nr:acyltransferase family protein [Egicoccus sp.]HSK21681.1 acyltransferase family protein [Egicoccus sp.]
MTATAVPVAPERPNHRPDIEGLRAVAVVLVLLFHADVPGFGGGYVGVDVFFVLSGFLITRLLLDERDRTGTIRLGEFYARRLRRLLPASSVVILFTVVAAWLVVPPLLFPATAVDGLWAAGWLANYRFVGQGLDYLASAGAESPLLHFWSLAVEEQFYLLWPALILLITRGTRPGARRRVTIVLTGVVVVSLVLSIVQTMTDPVVAYYSLHTRAWELALGGLLAIAGPVTARVRPAIGVALGVTGLGVLVATSVTYSTATPFPGWTALLPVLATCALLVAGQVADRRGVGVVLHLAPLQHLGKWSYALYLWHWPLLVLAEHAYSGELTVWHKVGLLVVTTGISAASYRLVENPVRRSPWLARRPARSIAAGLGLAASLIGLMAAAPLLGRSLGGSGAEIASGDVVDPGRLSDLLADSVEADLLPVGLRPPLSDARRILPQVYEDGCFQEYDEVRTPDRCRYGPGDDEPMRTIVLFGDSHGAHWFPTLHDLTAGRDWELVPFVKASCPAMDIPVFRNGVRYNECDSWRRNSLESIADLQPDMVVLSSSRAYDPVDEDGEALDGGREPFQAEGLRRMIARLRAAAPDTEIAVIGSTPQPREDAPVCLSAELDRISSCASRLEDALATDLLATQSQVAADAGAIFIDASSWLCHDGTCPAVIADYLVYTDGSHLAEPLTRWLRPVFEEALLRDSALPAP